MAHHPRRERRSWGPGPAATHLSAFSEVMGPLPVHVSEATPAGRYARSGRRDAANRRSSVSSRRLWEAHSSVVADSHDHALDATIVTVALRNRARPRLRRPTGTNAIERRAPEHDDRRDSDVANGVAVPLWCGQAKTIVDEMHGFRAKQGQEGRPAGRSRCNGCGSPARLCNAVRKQRRPLSKCPGLWLRRGVTGDGE